MTWNRIVQRLFFFDSISLLSPFWITFKSSFHQINAFLSSGSSLIASTFKFSLHFFMIPRQVLSTDLNFLFLAGNCFIISCESKIGWRYAHWPWYLIHSSSVSVIKINKLYQFWIFFSSNGFLNDENCIACVLCFVHLKSLVLRQIKLQCMFRFS